MYVLVKFDGAVQGNVAKGSPKAGHARAAYGFEVISVTGTMLHQEGARCAATTSNEAELHGLLAALRWVRAHGYRRVQIRGDAQFVCKTLSGDFRISQVPHLARLLYQISQEVACHTEPADDGKRRLILDPVSVDGRLVVTAVKQIGRKQNAGPDRLAADALDQKRKRPEGAPTGRS